MQETRGFQPTLQAQYGLKVTVSKRLMSLTIPLSIGCIACIAGSI
ncbi:MAG TPA: hypothetical protein VEZ13_11115 [Brevibacillus sp.]|nr:hypothetical protein [Brevibacillus sp.]